MATVKGPLFSLDASGTVGGAVVYAKWKGRNYVRRHAIPANPKSDGQLSVRAMMKFLAQFWTNLATVQQTDWETRAKVTNISPFNAYVAYNMARWGNFDLPSKLDPALEVGVIGAIANTAATAVSRGITLSADLTTINNNWAFQWFRSTTTGFTASRSNMIRVQPALTIDTFTWLDSPLTVGTEYFYLLRGITDDGVAGALEVEVSATPTA